ncbi:MAG: tetratricopeptide repeat protein [Chloroflexi bacterium]|nr:tetratricopeptide repeat protein [Chloroflexota bacterium]
MTNDASNSYIELRQSIDDTFSLADLRLLCADVGIEYEHLPGETRPTKILALLDHVARQSRQADLLHRLRELRPLGAWPTTYHVTHSGAVYAPPPLPERGVLPEPGPLPPGSRLLYSRNPLFTGRADDLLRLANTFLYEANGRDVIITQTAVAAGMGGIGKTQLAVEFAHRYGRYFPGGVFWLSFAEAANLPSEIAVCGGPDGLDLAPGFADLPLADQVKAVQQAWRQPVARLLIFDNCEEEKLLADWRPPHGGCHVLVTSRRQQWDRALGVSQLRLEVLPRAESVTLLRRLAPDLAESDADVIAAEVGDLPLALHLAGSFLATYRRVSPTDYLKKLRDKQILQHASMLGRGTDYSPTGHDLDVARTFAVSFERLDLANETDALALTLLTRLAFLAPGEPIPDDLCQELAPIDEDDEEGLLQVEDGWQRLRNLGFVAVEQDSAVRLHRLLALFAQKIADDPEDAQRATEKAVREAVSNRQDRAGYISPIPLLLPHLYFVTDAAMSRDDAQAGSLCSWLGYYLDQVAVYADAQPYYERALAINEQSFGPTHPDTAQSLNNLGYLLRAMGQLADARPYYERALAIREQALGPTHPDTALSLNNLGALLQVMGQLADARPYYERALAIREQALGPTHPDTARSLNNLGALLDSMGQLADARPYYERALAIREQALGPTHPDTALSLNNLGALLDSMGQLADARPYYERALAINEQALGPTHPDTALSLNNLGYLLRAMGQLADARPYYERALAIREQALGPTHPDTASSLNNLGYLLRAMGQLADARPYYERALAIREQALGPTHPDTAQSLNNLGYLLRAMGQLADARPYYERALAIYEQALGPTHPDTATSLNNLGELLRAMGQLADARPYYERALAIYEQALGPTHPDLAYSLNNLGMLAQAEGDLPGARVYLQRALSIFEAALGPEHNNTQIVRENLEALDDA